MWQGVACANGVVTQLNMTNYGFHGNLSRSVLEPPPTEMYQPGRQWHYSELVVCNNIIPYLNLFAQKLSMQLID